MGAVGVWVQIWEFPSWLHDHTRWGVGSEGVDGVWGTVSQEIAEQRGKVKMAV